MGVFIFLPPPKTGPLADLRDGPFFGQDIFSMDILIILNTFLVLV